MAFSGQGAASGAMVGSMFGPVGTVVGGLAGGFLGGNKKKSVELDPYAGMTPEQRQAMSLLQTYGATGKIGDFQAGEGYGNLGDFNFQMTPQELAGQTALDQYIGSGTPMLGTASDVLTKMANQQFNPDDPSSGFAAFQRQVARSGKQASDVLNREAAMTGSRFGTSIGRDKADLAAQQSDILASKLGEIWQNTQAQKLAAAQGLGNLQQIQDQSAQNRIQAAYQYGSMQRDLQNQQAQLAYDDWKRGREERTQSISALGTVLSKGTTPMWGGTTYEYNTPSGFQQVLNAGTSVMGTGGGGAGAGGAGGAGGIMNILKTFIG